jgi:HPt (histidine-containing phosphotransfer) domain-containing protein
MTLNQKHIEELQDVLGTDFAALVRAFLADAKPRLEQALSAFERGEYEAARKEFHTLKGSSANLGSIDFSERCLQLESRLKRGESPALERENLLGSFAALERALRQLLN